jgi:hypothetical protein
MLSSYGEFFISPRGGVMSRTEKLEKGQVGTFQIAAIHLDPIGTIKGFDQAAAKVSTAGDHHFS